jgi:hypothetical protein
MKFWGVFLAAIVGGVFGLITMAVVTPCYHDVVFWLTGREIPWNVEQHAYHANSAPSTLETVNTFTACWMATGWPIFLTYMFVGMGIAVVVYIVAIFACMCNCCCLLGRGRRYSRRSKYDGDYDDDR